MKKVYVVLSVVLLWVVSLISISLVQLSTAFAQQSSFPTKTVALVSHSAPGGGGDTFLRPLGRALQEVWGKTVIIENRAGGSGAASMNFVSDAPADGHTILGITNTHLITPLRTNIPKSMADFKPVARILLEGTFLYVKKDSKWTPDSFLGALLRGKENVKFGSAQAGTPDSMAVETLQKKYGAKINMIVIPDTPKAIVGVLSGDLDASGSEIAEIKPQLDAGNIRLLFTFNSVRHPSYPNVPTFIEKGFPEVVIDKFRALVVRKDTPQSIIKALENASQKALETSFYKQSLRNAEQIPAFLNSEDCQKFLAQTESFYKGFFGK